MDLFLEKTNKQQNPTTKPQKTTNCFFFFFETEVNKNAIIHISWCVGKEALSNIFTDAGSPWL